MLTAVRAPEALVDVFALLDSDPNAVLVGGGTTVVPALTAGTSGITQAVSLARLKESLAGIRIVGDEAWIGAATTLASLGRHPSLAFLAPALRLVGSPTLRSTATVGGNFFVAEPYGDVACCLVALDAVCTVLDANGEETVSAEVLAADGLGRGRILTEIRFVLPKPGSFRFHKAARRKLNSASIATVAAIVTEAGGTVSAARIALGGVAPSVRRARGAEQALVGHVLDETAARAAGEAALADADPFPDAHASAWYRARVLPVHVRRALLGAEQ